MPNWCQNRLIITAENEVQLAAFLERLRGPASPVYPPSEFDFTWANNSRKQEGLPPFDSIEEYHQHMLDEMNDPETFVDIGFHHLIPVPQDVVDQGYSMAGYGWQIDHWGTKWCVHDFNASGGLRIIEFSFDTPWSPPTGIINAIFEIACEDDFDGVNIEHLYLEAGMGFCGFARIEDGVVTTSEGTPVWDSDDWAEEQWETEEPTLLGPAYVAHCGFGNWA